MKIKEFAERFGIRTDTIRCYEKEGLLEVTRLENGYRTYDEICEKQLQFVLVLKQLSFTIKEIRELLSLKGKPISETCNQTVVALFVDKIIFLEQKINFYRNAIEALHTSKILMQGGKYAENESIVEEMILKMYMQSLQKVDVDA